MVVLSKLRLEIALSETESADYPILKIRIDDNEFSAEEPGQYIGFDPEQVLDTGALLPIDPPRRVAIYRCHCGVAGCGAIAAVIRGDGHHVRWEDVREFTGVYDDPLLDAGWPLPEDGGKRLPRLDVTFDAKQYFSEISRAASDRSWETDGRAASRMLRNLLEERSEHFLTRGWRLDWVGPESEGLIDVAFLESTAPPDDANQVVVQLPMRGATPNDKARACAEYLLHHEPSEWPTKVQGREWT